MQQFRDGIFFFRLFVGPIPGQKWNDGGVLVKTWRSLKSISSPIQRRRHGRTEQLGKWSEKKGEKHFHLAAGTTAFIVIVFPRFSSACVSLACCQIRFLILCWRCCTVETLFFCLSLCYCEN